MNSSNLSASPREVSLKDLFLKLRDFYRLLLSRWLTILVLILIGGILGFSYAYFKKPIYIATTTFVLEDSESSGGFGQYAGIASIAGIDLGGGSGGIFQGENILELYKSRTMIEKALFAEVDNNGSKQLLIDRYLDFTGLRKKWSKKSEFRNVQFRNIEFPRNAAKSKPHSRLQDSLLRIVVDEINKNNLSVVKPDKKLSIIKATVKAKDEFFAKAFNEQIVQKVNDFYVQTKTKKSLANVRILQHKVDSLKTNMNVAIYDAAAILDATPNLNPTKQLQRTAPMQRAQFTAEANKAMLADVIRNLELAKISLLKEAPLIQIIDSPILPLEEETVNKILSAVSVAFIFFLAGIVYLVLREILDFI